MKKILSLFLALAMIFGIFQCTGLSVTAFAASESDLTFELNRDGESYEITACNESASGDLAIPSEYNGLPVTEIESSAFKNCTSLKSITIPDGVTTIYEDTFYGCTSLKSITIPESVTYIGNSAFSGCTGLESITIPDGVTTIYEDTFYGCTSLKSITIPESVTYIGNSAFSGCTGLESITIPDSVTYIDNVAFYGCTSLKSITIPESARIGWKAFGDCTSLESITIPDSAVCMDYDIFVNTAYYKDENNWKNGVLYIGNHLIEAKNMSGSYAVKNGTKGIAGQAFSHCTSLTSVTIPESVTYIGMDAFYDCTSLESITIPNSVNSIGERAFVFCASLKSITISESTTSFGDDMFFGCSSDLTITAPKYSKAHEYAATNSINIIFDGETECLKYELNYNEDGYVVSGCFKAYDGELVIPSEYNGLPVTKIGNYAFNGCTSLKSITIPESVTYIEYYAFYGCTSLESITIPESVTEIGWCAFKGCSSDLTITAPKYSEAHAYALENSIKIIFNGELEYLKYSLVYDGWYDTYKEEYGVDNCSKAYEGELVIPSEYNGLPVTKIGKYAFEDCTRLTSVTIPENVTEIDRYAFEGCTSLKSITIPESVTYIGNYAFEGCTSLESITIPDGVTTIYEETFYGCTSLKSITIPKSVTDIESGAFEYCTSLKEINIPDNATYVDKDTFFDTAYYNDDSNWENGVLYIGNNLIAAKESVSGSYIVKNGTVKISRQAFENCTNLESITIPESVTYIDNSAFNGCTSLESITIPESVTSIGSDAFENCSSDLTITAPKYSYANDYAIENSIKFIPNGETEYMKYELNYDKNGYVVSKCSIAYEGELVIPSEYNGLPVTGIGEDAFFGCRYITAVKIPEGAVEIPDGAFYGCTSLKSVVIPSSVIEIYHNVFSNCTSLESIIIPEGVTYIGHSAFKACTSLKSITIPESVTSVGSDVLNGCTNLKELNILNPDLVIDKSAIAGTAFYNDDSNWENGLLYINKRLVAAKENISGSCAVKNGTEEILPGAFEGCTGLTSVTIPDSVTSIGYYAFSGCTSLESITIPQSVTYIDKFAFRGCTSLKKINIPDNATYVDEDMFSDSAYYNDDSNWEDGVLYISNHLVATKNSVSGSYVVKSGTVRILGGAFYGCADLKTVTIPDSVYEIGGGTFYSCSPDLTIIASKYSKAHEYAIKESINFIPNGELNYLQYQLNQNKDGYVVSDCFKAYDGELVIPSEYNGLPVTEIGDQAFYWCTSLESITIPEGVTKIGNSAFFGCTSLKSITIPAGVTEIDDCAFKYCESITSVILPDSLTYIGRSAFDRCTSLESVTIPGSVKTVCQETFYGCTNLKRVELLDGIKAIGPWAFWNCTSLEEVNIPKSVTSIGYSVLDGTAYSEAAENRSDGALYINDCLVDVNDDLPTSYEIKSGTRLIGDYAFVKNASRYAYSSTDNGEHFSITSVKIPKSVKSIGKGAFATCKELSSVEIEDGVESIGEFAFMNCNSLKAVTIPESVTEIGKTAFGFTGIKIHIRGKITDFTISGYKNSAAQKYAEEYGFAFNALGAVVADNESNIKVIGDVDENSALNVTLLNSNENKITYEITLTKDGKEIQPNGAVTVKIPVPEGLDGAKCRVYRAEANGKYTDVNAEFKDGFMVFETTHFSEYILTVGDLSFTYGDLNGDGKITAIDLALLRKYLANVNPATGESSVNVGKGADTNGDGKITAIDLALLRKYLANVDPATGKSTVTLGPKKQ